MTRTTLPELLRRLAQAEGELTLERGARTELRHRELWEESLACAVARVYEARAPRQVYEAIEEIAEGLFGCRELVVYLVDGARTRLHVAHARGDCASTARDGSAEANVARAVTEHRTIIGQVEGWVLPAVITPIGPAPRAAGAVVLYDALASARSFGRDELDLLETVARHAGIGLAACRVAGAFDR